jgi:amino acid transporter
MVGVIPMEKLSGNLTPVASAAEIFSNKVGVIFVSFAAILAFVSVANAGIMGASRYPFAMGRDHIMPEVFKKISKRGVPNLSILVTVGMILIIIVSFDLTKIAKLASTFQLLLFALLCFSLIIMRESKIESYDPGHFSPLYPWMQIFGIVTSFLIIIAMGVITMSLSLGVIIIGSFWYFFYVKGKVTRTGAIYNVFERLGKSKDSGIEYIFREQNIKSDPENLDSFDEI